MFAFIPISGVIRNVARGIGYVFPICHLCCPEHYYTHTGIYSNNNLKSIWKAPSGDRLNVGGCNSEGVEMCQPDKKYVPWFCEILYFKAQIRQFRKAKAVFYQCILSKYM